jgi:hypothetical protein
VYKLAQLAYEEDGKICRREAKVLQNEPNIMYRKFKEAARLVLAYHPIGQPSLDISAIWNPIIAAEISKLQLRPVQLILSIVFPVLVSYRTFAVLVRTFVPTEFCF